MYDLEVTKVIEEIKSKDAKRILIQLPDGLKHYSHNIVNEVEEKTSAQVFIWFGSCFGACDIPLGMDMLKIDLIIQWGHNKFLKEKW